MSEYSLKSGDSKRSEYDLLIMTNKYAGNFECEMLAYCTGHVDGRGEQMAALFRAEVPSEMQAYGYLKDIEFTSVFTEHGDRMVRMMESSEGMPNYKDDSHPNVGIPLDTYNVSDEILRFILERARKYGDYRVQKYGGDERYRIHVYGVAVVRRSYSIKTEITREIV